MSAQEKNKITSVAAQTDENSKKDQEKIPFWKKKGRQKEFLKKQLKRQFFGGGKKKGLPFGRRGI